MEHTKHIWRAALLLLALVVGATVTRHFLVPESFGQEGFYRYNSLSEFMASAPRHGNQAACGTCHMEQSEARAEGKHATVSCEVCHAPLATHAVGNEKIADMRIPPSDRLCAYCHQRLRARPHDMPQIDAQEHLEQLGVIEAGQEIEPGTCIVCHDVHSPSLD